MSCILTLSSAHVLLLGLIIKLSLGAAWWITFGEVQDASTGTGQRGLSTHIPNLLDHLMHIGSMYPILRQTHWDENKLDGLSISETVKVVSIHTRLMMNGLGSQGCFKSELQQVS